MEIEVKSVQTPDTIIEIKKDEYTELKEETAIEYITINRKFKWKQLLLFVPLCLITIFIIFYKKLLYNFYLGPSVFICSWLFFWYFPQYTIQTQVKPIYIEDLIINHSSEDIRFQYIKYYSYICNFCLSVLLMIIAEYAIIKISEKDFSIIELFGIIGGLISIYYKFQNTIARTILTICYKMKRYKFLHPKK
jgi:hypothetical protein